MTTVLILFMAFVLLVIIISFLPEEILERFSLSSLNDESNSKRISHWIAAVEAFAKKPILGYGASHTMTILTQYASHVSDAHNTVLTFLLHFGLVGFLPICILFLQIFMRLSKAGNKVWLFFFGGYIFINLIIANHLGISFWIPLVLFYSISKNNKEF